MAIPQLPDEVHRHIAAFWLRAAYTRTARPLDIKQQETTFDSTRRVGRARGWIRDGRAKFLIGGIDLDPVPDIRYNFTLMRRADGGVGVLESNCGEQYWNEHLDAPHGFVGLLPWGARGVLEAEGAGWSRATRRVPFSVEVWCAPVAWGFGGLKNSYSKIIVMPSDDDPQEPPPETEGIVDIDVKDIERLESFPRDALTRRTV